MLDSSLAVADILATATAEYALYVKGADDNVVVDICGLCLGTETTESGATKDCAGAKRQALTPKIHR
jgi:hypothetical protein